MATSYYNNPHFGNSIARMITSVVGNPAQRGAAELAASQALLNNQTAQYRDAIGDTGLSGDLASMMIRSLQAGPDYARYAPGLADSALKYGAMGMNPGGNLTPSPEIANLILSGMRGRGGRGGGGSGSAPKAPRALTQSDMNRVDRRIRQSGWEGDIGAQVMDRILKEYGSGGYGTLDEAAGAILPGVEMDERVIDPNTWASGENLGESIANLFQSPVTEDVLQFGGAADVPPVGATVGAPTGTTADVPDILAQARAAIAAGKDPAIIKQRLTDMGIDPGAL